MTDYQAPVRQMRFTIEHLADFKAVAALPDFSSGQVLRQRARADQLAR